MAKGINKKPKEKELKSMQLRYLLYLLVARINRLLYNNICVNYIVGA